MSFYWEHFRKAGNACDMNIKINILMNFGQFENEIPPPTKQHLNLEFLDCENAKNISKMALCAGTARKKHQKGTQGKKAHKCRYGSFRICSSLYFKGIIKKNLYFFFFFFCISYS